MIWFKRPQSAQAITTSILYDEHTFYQAFMSDLQRCKKEIIIESPFITSSRMEVLYPIFRELLARQVKIHIITKDPSEYDEHFRYQATNEILYADEMGINVILLKGNHHRKLAIIDKKILWEGSLNILSYSQSKEIMRRIKGAQMAKETLNFLRINEFI